MSIASATVCECHSENCHSRDIENPTWEDISSAIKALDGKSRNDLYLTANAKDLETYLCIGGGNGRYIVSGSIQNERFPTVVRLDESSSEMERLIVGGQEGLYPRSWIVDYETAVVAARSFYETGKFGGADLEWQDV